MSQEGSPRLCGVTPILNVSDFAASMRYYTEKLGFRKAWDWGEPAGLRLRDPGRHRDLPVPRRAGTARHLDVDLRGRRERAPRGDEGQGRQDRDASHRRAMGHARVPCRGPGWPHLPVRPLHPGARDLKIKRTAVDARMEERLAAVLADLAKETNRSVGEVLEEVLLHSFEPLPGQIGEAVASPHAKSTFHLIEGLKKKHGLDYDTHANYRFTEE